MIRLYEPGDELSLDPNEFSDWHQVEAILADAAWWKYTCVDEGIRAIVCFFEYQPTKFALFGLFSKKVRARHGKELKQLLENGINILRATHVQTCSQNCVMLNRWHEYLGFTIERPEMVDGKDCYVWGKAV